MATVIRGAPAAPGGHMPSLARLSVALSTALAPALVLAQEAGGRAAPAQSEGGMSWLWIIAAVALAVILFRMFSRRRHGPHPPARAP
jgi:hypothetical protein